MLRKASLVFGVVFLLVGVLGFVPGVTVAGEDGMQYLLGLFMVDTLHNVVHILSGVVGIAASMSDMYAKWYLLGFGAVYALVAIVGLVDGSSVLGLFMVNFNDNMLHVALAVALLAAGLLLKPGMASAAPTMPAGPAKPMM